MNDNVVQLLLEICSYQREEADNDDMFTTKPNKKAKFADGSGVMFSYMLWHKF